IEAGLRAERVIVVHNGVDTEQFRELPVGPSRKALDISENALVALFAGRLDPGKGIEVLLEAWPICRRSEEDRLLVASLPFAPGRPEQTQAYMERLVARQPPGVIWLGQRADMPEVYAAADVLVFPSVWPEPFGRSIVEGMAC